MFIEGLSPLQQEIATRLWNCDTPEQRDQEIQLMPKNVQKHAFLVVEMMLLTAIDQYLEEFLEFPEIKEFLKSC